MTAGQAQRDRVRQRVSERRRARRAHRVRQRRVPRRELKAFSLAGATEFSSDRTLSNAARVIELFKQQAPDVCLELMRRTTPERAPNVAGAPRMNGSWALAFLAHIMAGNPDWQNWYDDNATNTPLWEACGFPRVPSFSTLHERFAELEDPRYVSAFTEAANHFIRIAAAAQPLAFRFFHTDGTPVHSHSKFTHACPSDAYCQTRLGPSPAQTVVRASDDAIADDRHERSADAEPENPDAPPPPHNDDTSNKLERLTDDEAMALGLDDWRRSSYWRWGPRGHIMRCRDKQAAVRMYSAGPRRKKKVWLGGYFLPAVDDFHGAPVAVVFNPADQQEHLAWPELYKKAAHAIGDDADRPRRIIGAVADRAFTNKSFISHNTTRGIASITPVRKLPGGREWENLRDPAWRFDEHAPRCKHCGGPAAPLNGDRERFEVTQAGDPRIYFRCVIGWTPACQKLQSISCKKEYRALLPISRRERIFHDLYKAHSNFEGVFDSWRDRYAVSGTSQANRSKRRNSIPAQQLRAAAALVAEWFRICLRHGYIDGHPQRNTETPKQRTGGAKGIVKVIEHRREHQLDLPQGPASQALGIPPPAGSP